VGLVNVKNLKRLHGRRAQFSKQLWQDIVLAMWGKPKGDDPYFVFSFLVVTKPQNIRFQNITLSCIRKVVSISDNVHAELLH
jgi:hypothetical protein|tara:strand:+ start:2931 stop:3176 length:246 start_codon:yes stop_codon:yes gene_type:complete